MRIGWMALALAAAATGGLAFAQDGADHRLRYGKIGDDAPFFYHQLSAGCDFLMHVYGRNAAWGAWRLPLAEVSQGRVSTAGAGEAAVVQFDCRDGSACIGEGRLTAITGRISSHEIPFETAAGAETFLTRLTDLRAGCAAR